ncbi:hypothetical protein ONZ43_g1507 [Nemania bipapillata]|uniref:Uncharacterized protein n=1 Tax=Nemania bipapillata TaxID=110536 RepID=A0ACC2J4G1_9PEZI|nr:hypothetical protein ONZ43_g1507 [Nemania bipapillata]
MTSVPKARVVVVTGISRGIGRSICHQLATGYAGPLVLYAASRAGKLPDLDPASVSTTVKIIPLALTITEQASVNALASRIRTEQGCCDVLINNAGVYHYNEVASKDQRLETYNTNFHGTVRHDVVEGQAVRRGWPRMAYFPSKAALNAATRILARDNPDLLINCCCPGWVDTELGGQAGRPPKTPEQGAAIPLRLAFGNIKNINGRYWANDSVSDIGPGKTQPW